MAGPQLLKDLIADEPAHLAALPSIDLGLPQHEHVWNLIGLDARGPPFATNRA